MEHPKIQTMGEARSADFQRHAKLSREIIKRADDEIAEALIENQVKMAEDFIGKEWIIGL